MLVPVETAYAPSIRRRKCLKNDQIELAQRENIEVNEAIVNLLYTLVKALDRPTRGLAPCRAPEKVVKYATKIGSWLITTRA